MKEIEIYCDGSSIGNPGPGGWGAVIADKARAKEIGGYDAHTTNNRMELMAGIQSLRLIKARAKITIHTDSSYVINGITKWAFGWQKNDWMTKEKKDVLNKELWQDLVEASKKHDVTWKHVKGHSGVAQNERADMIANGFARKENVKLFYGSLSAYKKFLSGMPKARVVSKGKNKGKAYSYVSLIEGKVTTYKVWADCERAVKGKKAQFKKVLSKEEEKSLVALWSS